MRIKDICRECIGYFPIVFKFEAHQVLLQFRKASSYDVVTLLGCKHKSSSLSDPESLLLALDVKPSVKYTVLWLFSSIVNL